MNLLLPLMDDKSITRRTKLTDKRALFYRVQRLREVMWKAILIIDFHK